MSRKKLGLTTLRPSRFPFQEIIPKGELRSDEHGVLCRIIDGTGVMVMVRYEDVLEEKVQGISVCVSSESLAPLSFVVDYIRADIISDIGCFHIITDAGAFKRKPELIDDVLAGDTRFCQPETRDTGRTVTIRDMSGEELRNYICGAAPVSA